MIEAALKDLIHYTLKPHQPAAIRYLLGHHYAILGDEQGLGKTVEALCVSLLTSKKTLIVCPAYLKLNWEQEIKSLCKVGKSIWVHNGPKSLDKLLFDHDFYIVSYSSIEKVVSLFREVDCIIADECQHLKNLESGRTLRFHSLIGRYQPPRLILASGTTIENGVVEWYSVLRLMSYSPWDTNGPITAKYFSTAKKFNDYFCFTRKIKIKTRGSRFRWVVKHYGLKNKEKLWKLLKGKYIRRLKKDVLDLAVPQYRKVIVAYKSDKKLEKLWEDFNNGIDKGHISGDKKISALNKVKYTIQYADDLRQEVDSPIVIFSCHPQAVEEIAKGLSTRGFNCRSINGTTSVKLRQRFINELQEGRIDFLVATIGSASTGYTMTKANQMIMNDRDWVPSKNAQARDRIHRIGQENNVTYHDIIGSRIDDLIYLKLKEKEEVLKEVI